MQAVAQCVDAELMNGTMDQAGTHLLGGVVFPQEQTAGMFVTRQ